MLAIVRAATLLGVRGEPVSVEVHVSNGIPGFTIVGLPDTSCREARDRVRAALLSTGLTWPQRRITVNLAPSGVRKVGAGLDLAIAVALLVADEQLAASATELGYLGELGLDGAVRPIPGALPMAAAIDTAEIVVAEANGPEAVVLGHHSVRTVGNLADVVACVAGERPWSVPTTRTETARPDVADLADVRGNTVARFALEVAAAGGHHLLMVGPPGAGKTMLAERLPGLLGDLDPDTALEVTTVHSAAGQPLPPCGLIRHPPFRAPHHTVSQVALVGGGSHNLRPGEISLATGGVLFLDELGEFGAHSLDALRQPLEEGVVRISRAHASASMPARFQLVAAMNPCPCGLASTSRCRCTDAALARYRRRLSGPLLDRFDLRILVRPTSSADLVGLSPGEPTSAVALRVERARARARERGVDANRYLGAAELEGAAPLTGDARSMLARAIDDGRLSGRGLRRVRAVALTLADLNDHEGPIPEDIVAEAMALRAELTFGAPIAGAA